MLCFAGKMTRSIHSQRNVSERLTRRIRHSLVTLPVLIVVPVEGRLSFSVEGCAVSQSSGGRVVHKGIQLFEKCPELVENSHRRVVPAVACSNGRGRKGQRWTTKGRGPRRDCQRAKTVHVDDGKRLLIANFGSCLVVSGGRDLLPCVQTLLVF
jgi:hypothetical protein